MTGHSSDPQAGRFLLAVGLLLIAFNLRPVFSSLAPVLPELMATLGISPAGASVLATGPVLCLGLFAPVAPALAERYGTERLLLVILVALAVGTGLRGFASFPVLLLGSLVAGASISILNVLMPALVKRDFPDRAALMTGAYSMLLCIGAAVAAGGTVPLMHALGGSWPAALAAWGAPVVVAALFWGVTQGRARREAGMRGPVWLAWLWRNPLAWQVTLFMGMQSAMAYCVFGWLAPILRERGLDAVTAGLVVSVSIFSQMASSFVSPWLATRGRDQRPAALLLVGLATAGFLGALLAPLSTVWGWAVMQGIGQGGLFSVTMTIIILRSPDPRVAAALSGMAQGVGYVLAGAGPLVVGLLRGWTGGFAAAAVLFAAIGAVAAAAGWGAGRARLVGGPGRNRTA